MSKAHKKAYKKKKARAIMRMRANKPKPPQSKPPESNPPEFYNDDMMQPGGDYTPPPSPPRSLRTRPSNKLSRMVQEANRKARAELRQRATDERRVRSSCSKAGLALRMCPGSGKGPVRQR